MKANKRASLLWAPWRKTYLRSSSVKKRGCLFCRLLRERKDKKNLVVFRSAHHALILNKYPYNNGHLMIVPRRHIEDFSEFSVKEEEDFFQILYHARHALKKAMRPHGFNIGMNIGDIAGAGIPEHLHWHIVPRWKGDVNFMPVIAGTKVISESLESVYDGVSKALRGRRLK